MKEELETEEKYEAIVRYWEEKGKCKIVHLSKELGVNRVLIQNAIDYINDKRENPKA